MKYKEIGDFFENASKEEQEALIMDCADKANKEQKALVDRVKKKEEHIKAKFSVWVEDPFIEEERR